MAENSATTSDARGEIDIAGFIDSQPVGRFQIQLLLTCAAVLFIDGFDTQAIGYVAPAVAQDWKLARGALGPVFGAGLFGLMIGALLLGPVADRIGRRRIIIVCTIAFGLGTLATIFASDISNLMIIRFLTGLGLGGAMPNAVALTSEFSPHRRRATMVMTMFCGFVVGAAIGGLLAAALIPAFGWRSVFVVGGAVPLLLVLLLAAWLPESVRFLALSGDANDGVAQLLTRINPSIHHPAGIRFVVQEIKLPGIPVMHLLSGGRAWATLFLWALFFMSLLDLHLLSNWLPTVLNELGASVSVAAVIGSMLQVGGIVGTFALGKFLDRFSFRALALTYAIAAIAVAAIGFSSHSIALTTIAIFCAGFCVVGGQGGSNALSATLYPTAIRSTGVGWALGIGRVGSIVGPLVGGIMLARQMSSQSVFVAAAVPALCASLAAYALSRMARGQESTEPADPRGVIPLTPDSIP